MYKLIDAKTWETLAVYEELPEEISEAFERLELYEMGIILGHE